MEVGGYPTALALSDKHSKSFRTTDKRRKPTNDNPVLTPIRRPV